MMNQKIRFIWILKILTGNAQVTQEAERLLRSKNVFISTKARAEIERLMLERKVVFVSGLPGSGKTSACLDILRTYQDIREGKIFSISVYSDIQEVNAAAINDHTIIMFDDCLEKWFYIQTKRETEEEILGKIFKRISKLKNAFALFTMRPCTEMVFHNQISAWTNEYELTYVEMESIDARLTKEECRDFLRQKATFYKQNVLTKLKDGNTEELVTQALTWQNNVGQIEALEILFMSPDYDIVLKTFFMSPTDQLKKDFKNHFESESTCKKWQYCTMVYLLMKGGTAEIKPIDFPLMMNIVQLLRFKDLRQGNLSVICPWTVRVDEDLLTFQHEFVLTRFFFHMLAPNESMDAERINFTVKHCDIRILLKYCRISGVRHRDERDIFSFHTGFLLVDYRALIAKRFAQTYSQSKDEAIKNHVNMTDEVFKSEFEKEVLQLQVDPEVPH